MLVPLRLSPFHFGKIPYTSLSSSAQSFDKIVERHSDSSSYFLIHENRIIREEKKVLVPVVSILNRLYSYQEDMDTTFLFYELFDI